MNFSLLMQEQQYCDLQTICSHTFIFPAMKRKVVTLCIVAKIVKNDFCSFWAELPLNISFKLRPSNDPLVTVRPIFVTDTLDLFVEVGNLIQLTIGLCQWALDQFLFCSEPVLSGPSQKLNILNKKKAYCRGSLLAPKFLITNFRFL